MLYTFKTGPIGRIPLRLTGEAQSHYGQYEAFPEEIQDALQLICHAVIQLAPEIKQSENGVYRINNTYMIVNLTNGHIDTYSLSNFMTGMAIMNLCAEGDGNYSTDFFAVKQLALTDRIIECADLNAFVNGRRELTTCLP